MAEVTKRNLDLQVRERTAGRGRARALRRQGCVPAVVYGPRIKNLNAFVEERHLDPFLHSRYENSILTLRSSFKGLDGLQVLKKEAVLHPVSRRVEHVDFYALDMQKLVRVHVEVKFLGRSAGERDGGVFSVVRREVEVECLPAHIPAHFEIRIDNLKMNENLHVSDLALPEGVRLITAPDQTLATVADVVEEVVEEAPAAAAADAATTDSAAKVTD